jgi:phenylacetate-coenzyme A ligase PaaK-like adenylate-forming protein
VARWIEGRRREGRPCLLRSTATSVVRVCEAARASGIDVDGARFQMTGEPVTRSKHDAVRAVGGVPIVSYGSVDAGRMGFSCPSSEGPDDLHLMTDTHAFVRHRRSLERFGVEIEPLLVTTLSEDAPLVLLNVELDDYGELEERPCDCRWGKLGLTRRISNVRSFVKLTADGTTLVGTRLLELLESELPSRFGGGPTHYQLVEEERGSRTELVLRVDPCVGPIEEEAALALVYRRIREQDGAGRISSDLWHAADAVRIARDAPIVTAGGKQLPIVPLRPQ